MQIKRSQKEEEARLKEEKERERKEEERRIEEARQYYRRGLMIKYGVVPLCRNVERTREAEMTADELYIKWVKKYGMIYYRLGLKE